ncbi:MAG: DNA polymerase/3'-5' exonuclease PolX [Limnochordia bacterium]|jgi:DNA polymerase (family 10)
MRNLQLAWIFSQIANILEIKGENPHKIRAYKRAAREIAHLPTDIGDIHREGQLRSIPGIGPALADKIDQWLTTGEMDYYEELQTQIPAGLLELLNLPGIGPKTISTLHQELGIRDVEDLERAARKRKIRTLKGMGVKTEKAILHGITMWRSRDHLVLAALARPQIQDLVFDLQGLSKVDQAQIVGGLRRRKDMVGHGDILLITRDIGLLREAVGQLPQVQEILAQEEYLLRVRLKTGLEVQFFLAAPETAVTALTASTGSQRHWEELQGLAHNKGWQLSFQGLFQGEQALLLADEGDLYGRLGLDFIPPELREGRGEIAAAQAHGLPRLVEKQDIQGDLHVHSHYSDGTASIEEMAQAMQARGIKYLAICDHSRSLGVARGLTIERLRRQGQEIRELNKRLTNFKVLRGAEVDILADGSLDFPDDVLAELDVVVASIHTGMGQSSEQITNRLLAAINNPHVDIIGHPTGRLLGRREPYKVDMERVIEAAAKTGTALEINSFPDRLDLNDVHARWAKEAGVLIAIDTDAHSPGELDYLEYGIGTARRAWLEKDDILNCRSWEELQEIFARCSSTTRR